jgi:hypothetical protein
LVLSSAEDFSLWVQETFTFLKKKLNATGLSLVVSPTIMIPIWKLECSSCVTVCAEWNCLLQVSSIRFADKALPKRRYTIVSRFSRRQVRLSGHASQRMPRKSVEP